MESIGHGRGTTGAQLTTAAGMFALLSSRSRLHLVWLLSASEHDVFTLAELTAMNPAAARQHLAKLRRGGVVTSRRNGRRQVYRVENHHLGEVIFQMVDSASVDQPVDGAHFSRTTHRVSDLASAGTRRLEAH